MVAAAAVVAYSCIYKWYLNKLQIT